MEGAIDRTACSYRRVYAFCSIRSPPGATRKSVPERRLSTMPPSNTTAAGLPAQAQAGHSLWAPFTRPFAPPRKILMMTDADGVPGYRQQLEEVVRQLRAGKFAMARRGRGWVTGRRPRPWSAHAKNRCRKPADGWTVTQLRHSLLAAPASKPAFPQSGTTHPLRSASTCALLVCILGP